MLELLRQLSPWVAVKDLASAGGPVVVWIMLACLTMWAMIIERYWFFKNVLPRQAEAMLTIWRARKDHKSWTARQIRRTMISRLNGAMSVTLPCCA